MKLLTVFVLAGALILAMSGCQGQNRYGDDNNASSLPSPTPPGNNLGVTYQTTDQAMNATGTAKQLTWNLGTQIVGADPLPGGGTFTITVQIVTSPTGQPQYQFTNPTITGGTSAIEATSIGFFLNDVFQTNATTYSTLDRFIPIQPANRILSPTAEIIAPASSPVPADKLAITFGALKPTVFAPATYTQLKGTGGIFTSNCISCHSAANKQGGLDLTNYSYLISNYEAVPFQPTNSKIIIRMTSPTQPMPQTGDLPAGSIQPVSDWILDGAPNN